MHATILINNEEFWLLPQRAMYWPRKKMLLVADVHLGKTSHFRKHGIALNPHLPKLEIDQLQNLVAQINPAQLVFLGDLFHADYNPEWSLFLNWSKPLSCETILVAGNHDKNLIKSGASNAIKTVDAIVEDGFLLTHEPTENTEGLYNIYGHIHPGFVMRGKGRQTLRLPCFVVGRQAAILPAFGLTTGLVKQKPNKKTRYFLIAANEVLEVNKPL